MLDSFNYLGLSHLISITCRVYVHIHLPSTELINISVLIVIQEEPDMRLIDYPYQKEMCPLLNIALTIKMDMSPT